jgi:hypothetical protein
MQQQITLQFFFMQTTYAIVISCALPFFCSAQLQVERGAGLYLQHNALISLQGDLQSAENIDGTGTFILNGSDTQKIGASGHALPSVLIDNANGVSLTSSLKINNRLVLHAGNLSLNRNNIELGSEATAVGHASAYIVSDGYGDVIKDVGANLDGFLIPVGTPAGYLPVSLKSSGKYTHASLAISALYKVNPNKPASSKDYLHHYWTIRRIGINGDVFVTAVYDRLTGDARHIRPFLWNGRQWIKKETPVDINNKLLRTDIPEGTSDLYAMHESETLFSTAPSMTLLPNPVQHTATLLIGSVGDESAVLRITDHAGATVMTRRVNLQQGLNAVRINVLSLAAGHYIISSTQKDSQAISMIKQ